MCYHSNFKKRMFKKDNNDIFVSILCKYPVHGRGMLIIEKILINMYNITRILYIDTQNRMSQAETTEETIV